MGDASAPDRLRLFVALRIPEEVKTAISGAQTELRERLPAGGITWTKPEQFHLTLKFLGNVETHRVDSLTKALLSACLRLGPLHLRAERMGAFPSLRFARVIWVGLNDAEQKLQPVQQTVESACFPFTAEKSEDRFSGHVTLARVKRLARSEAPVLAGLVNGMEKRFFGSWTANELELMQSELGAEGARHTCIEKVTFG